MYIYIYTYTHVIHIDARCITHIHTQMYICGRLHSNIVKSSGIGLLGLVGGGAGTNSCIYIYIYRERERERYNYVYVYIYIYIYIHK